MPIYEYRCDDCGASFEAFQKMSDDPHVECDKCGGPLRKVLHPVAIHFKGSGFYTTDYGKGSGKRGGVRDAGAGEESSSTAKATDKATGGDGESSKPEKAPSEGKAKAKEPQKAT